MRRERHRSLPAGAEDQLLAWLPHAELTVSLRDHLTRVEVVVDHGRVDAGRDDDLVHAGRVVAVGAVVEGRGGLSAAEVVLACAGDPRAAPMLAEAVEQEAGAAGGVEVVGPAAVARPVVDALAERTGGHVTEVMGQRLMAATRAVSPHGVPGRARRMVDDDIDLVGGWLDAFTIEALGREPRSDVTWRERLADTDWVLWLWEHEEAPVSLVNARATTPVSSRIGPVYTPPAHRGRGYAGALVAAATAACLGGGDERVTLFTDVANPTSNALYARVGFTDVCAHGSWQVQA